MFTVLDLFAGAGGFSCGFQQAGFKIIGAVEIDKHAAYTYQKNHPGTKLFQDDIRILNPGDILSEIGQPDVIIGGPPCQGFSIAGKRELHDERNTLPLYFISFIQFFKPKAFIMENVKGLISMDKGRLLDFFIQSFEESGYHVQYQVLNTYHFGIPQLRERIIIVGIRKDIDTPFCFPEKSTEFLSLYDVIGDIEQTGTYEETHLHNHDFYTRVDEHIYSKLKEGQFLCDVRHGKEHIHSWEISLKGECSSQQIQILNAISENRRKKCYGPKDGNPLSIETIQQLVKNENIYEDLERLVKMKYLEKIGDRYDIHDRKVNMGLRRFHRDKPINTITTQSGANSTYAHYSQPRNLTVRETARIQTFPDDFIFYGPYSSQYRQVGNAVPPKLAKAIALQLRQCLSQF